MDEPDWETIAAAAYQAYGLATGNKNFRGDPMPEWAQLPDKIRLAWRESSIAVALLVTERGMRGDLDTAVVALRSILDILAEGDVSRIVSPGGGPR